MIPANIVTFKLDDDHVRTIAVTPVVTIRGERTRLVLMVVESGFDTIKDDIVLMQEYLTDNSSTYYARTPVERYTDYALAVHDFSRRLVYFFPLSDEFKAHA